MCLRLGGLLGENIYETLRLCLQHSVARATKANPVAKMTCCISLLTEKMIVCVCVRARAAVIEMQSPDANSKSFWGDTPFFTGTSLPSHRNIYPGSTPALQQ